jgi:hypothetical protein
MYVGISQWEADFLHDATQWPIRPSPARQEKLDQIISGIVRRTKQTPPP